MRKNLTEIVFILDRSGSMSGLETDTIGGFNSMIEKQKKENGEALISTVLFDNVSEVNELNPETNLAALSLNIANNTPIITNGITKTPHSQNPIFIAYSSFTNSYLS